MFPATNLPDLVPEAEFIQQARAYAESYLTKCRSLLAAKGIKAGSSVEVGNDVAGTIMEVVAREHIDMVVISTHGISGWHPFVFGSIAEKVVKLVKFRSSFFAPRSQKRREGWGRPLNGVVVA